MWKTDWPASALQFSTVRYPASALNEEVWTVADAIDDLVQNEPDNMASPSERTVVQVAYDDRYVYVAARCYAREDSQVTTGLRRRDNVPPSDLNYWTVGVNTRHELRVVDDLDTRGGPPIVRPARTSLNLNVGSDFPNSWQVFLGLSGERDEDGTWNARIGLACVKSDLKVPSCGP